MSTQSSRPELKPDSNFNYISHRQADYVLDEVEFMLDHLRHTGEALGNRLTGPTNAGKSTVMKELCRRYPRVKTSSGYKIPVLYVPLPERAQLFDVYINILLALGDPAYNIGKEKELKYRARDLSAKSDVWLFIFDEPHHLTELRSEGSRLGLTQLGKSLIDNGRCVVFSGVKSVDDLVAQSDELARRFRGKISLGPYRVAIADDINEMRQYCNAVGNLLKYVEPIQFGDDNYWFSRLLAFSNGLVGNISQIVGQAESRARRAGDKKLTMQHLSTAWRYFSSSQEERLQHLKNQSGTGLINVFKADDSTVESIIGKMAQGVTK